MPPPSPRPAPSRGMGLLDPEALRGAYDVYHRTPRHALVVALRRHFKGLRPDRCFALAPLALGAANIYVRQCQALLSPQERCPSGLLDAWTWWFNLHQPDQG